MVWILLGGTIRSTFKDKCTSSHKYVTNYLVFSPLRWTAYITSCHPVVQHYILSSDRLPPCLYVGGNPCYPLRPNSAPGGYKVILQVNMVYMALLVLLYDTECGQVSRLLIPQQKGYNLCFLFLKKFSSLFLNS